MNRACVWLGLMAMLAPGCAPMEEPGRSESNVSAAVRRERATLIRDVARATGITNGLMVAMLAEEETYLSHCANEFPACPGPTAGDCGGRPVMSGGGDGPCSRDQGGLGMFQIDDGTESDTVRVHGARVLSLRGNTEVAIERVIDKVRRSRWTTNASTRERAIAWINELRIDDSNWDNYIRTLVRYWNGCPETARCWSNRYTKYDAAARTLLREMGHDFWYGQTPTMPMGTAWLASPVEEPRVRSWVSHPNGTSYRIYDCSPPPFMGAHKGTDFVVPVGTPVHAAAAGTVIRSVTGCPTRGSMASSCGGSLGNHVIVLHDGGMATLYAHLSAAAGQVQNGARVECGALVGLSGNSGRSSGAHLHFEVRAGVRDATTYFRNRDGVGVVIDPFGGRCSTQAESLWIGGQPTSSCVASERDDAAIARSTYPREVPSNAGARLTQTFVWRNTGTTTWNSDAYELRHVHGAFSERMTIALPSTLMTAPGELMEISVEVTVPSAPGQHAGEWQLARRSGGTFGARGSLKVRVPRAARSCQSTTLGRAVDSGACVQISYAGCGMASCGWYACADGAWLCASESACTGETNPHPSCCMAGTADGGTCTTSACGRTGQICVNDEGCCDGFRCVAGACQDPTTCGIEQDSCTSGRACCAGLSCLANTFGSEEEECCVGWEGGYCRNADDCCGEMTCSGNRCINRRAGESCATHWDCAGTLACMDGTCR
jgi:murein DD-endopeptidase MepM/ murein hydrolase activator NlpD